MNGFGELTPEEETNLLLSQIFAPNLAVDAPASTASDFTSQPWFWPAVIGGGILLFMSMGKGKRRSRRR